MVEELCCDRCDFLGLLAYIMVYYASCHCEPQTVCVLKPCAQSLLDFCNAISASGSLGLATRSTGIVDSCFLLSCKLSSKITMEDDERDTKDFLEKQGQCWQLYILRNVVHQFIAFVFQLRRNA